MIVPGPDNTIAVDYSRANYTGPNHLLVYDPKTKRLVADLTLDVAQSEYDAITQNSGPELRAALARVMKHPSYRDAHATDEHFIPALFCAGAARDWEDVGSKNILGAESWELTNMCNSQYTLGGIYV